TARLESEPHYYCNRIFRSGRATPVLVPFVMVFEIVRDGINDCDFAEPRFPMNGRLGGHDGGLSLWKCWMVSHNLSNPCRNRHRLNDRGLPQDERRRNEQ